MSLEEFRVFALHRNNVHLYYLESLHIETIYISIHRSYQNIAQKESNVGKYIENLEFSHKISLFNYIFHIS